FFDAGFFAAGFFTVAFLAAGFLGLAFLAADGFLASAVLLTTGWLPARFLISSKVRLSASFSFGILIFSFPYLMKGPQRPFSMRTSGSSSKVLMILSMSF